MQGLRILVVEDDFLLAEDLRRTLEDFGAIVIGPLPTLSRALAQVENEARLDGAILDINLGGEQVFPLADRLTERGVPFLFMSGYDKATIPARFAGILLLPKPLDIERLQQAAQRVFR